MNTERRFTDEELTAYLDGEHDHTSAREIETALATDKNLAERLAALDLNKQDLKSALDILLPAAPKMPVTKSVSISDKPAPNSQSGFLSLSKIAALPAALCICTGLLAGYMLSSNLASPQQSWRQYVAAYQALYVNGTLSNIEFDHENAILELDRVSKALGKEFEISSLTGADQLDYKRAQILGFNGKPLIQMAFLSKTGDPVALCIIKASSNSTEKISVGQMEGMKTAAWQKDGYAYLLIGGADSDMIEKSAATFANKL